MQYSGGIHTDKVEGDGAGKVYKDGCSSGASVDTNPLICGEVASGTQRHILKTGDISCGTVCPIGREGREQWIYGLGFKRFSHSTVQGI